MRQYTSVPLSSLAHKSTAVDRGVGTSASPEKAPPRVSGVQPKVKPVVKKKSKKSNSPTGVEPAELLVAPAAPQSTTSLPLSSNTRPAEIEVKKDSGIRLKRRKTSHKTSQEDTEKPVASSSKAPVTENQVSQELSPQKKVQWSADVPKESVGFKEKDKSSKKAKKATLAAAPEVDDAPIRKKKKKTLDNTQDDGASSKEQKKKTSSDVPTQSAGASKDKVQSSSAAIRPKKKAKEVPTVDTSSSQKVPDAKEKGKSKETTTSSGFSFVTY